MEKDGDGSGLFGAIQIGATIKNLHIVSGSISGSRTMTGSLVGFNSGGKIESCSNSATVNSNGSLVGGICGYNAGHIIACANSGTVSGNEYVGGITGRSLSEPAMKIDVTITACYNLGAVTGKNYIAGIAAEVAGSYLTACYNTGNITSTNYSDGGIISAFNSGHINACYWKDGQGSPLYLLLPDESGFWMFGEYDNAAKPKKGWPSIGNAAGQNPEWGIGNGSGSGKYWKSLGSWNGGAPQYPKLWWEE